MEFVQSAKLSLHEKLYLYAKKILQTLELTKLHRYFRIFQVGNLPVL